MLVISKLFLPPVISTNEKTYMSQFYFRERSVLVVHRNTFHGIKRRIGTINDLAKDCVLVFQMRLFCIGYEELGFVGIGARICHGNHTPIVKLGKVHHIGIGEDLSRKQKKKIGTFNVDRISSSKGFPQIL